MIASYRDMNMYVRAGTVNTLELCHTNEHTQGQCLG